PASLRPPDVPVGPWLTTTADPPPASPWRPVGPPPPPDNPDPGRPPHPPSAPPRRPVGPPAALDNLDPGRSAVATFDWIVPPDLPRDLCLLAVATAGGVWTTGAPPSAAGLPSRTGGPDTGGRGSGASGSGAPGVDPADLVTTDGRWGCKSLTVLRQGRGRVVRLDLLGAVGRGPFGLAAEGWVTELTGGVVL